MANKINSKMDELFNGCILASIAHAIMMIRFPLLAHEHSWRGINYNIQDSAGTRGTITFTEDACVGAFRNEKSERAKSENYKDALEYFTGASKKIIELAKAETLDYLYDYVEEAEEGMAPVITTAFWGNKDELLTADSLVVFSENGGRMIQRQTMGIREAIEEWEDSYGMTEEQVTLLKSLYTRKIVNPNGEIVLTKEEIAMIGTFEDEDGRTECITSFKEMNITLDI